MVCVSFIVLIILFRVLLAQTHYRVLAQLYQCFEVRYSSIIGVENTEKFSFPAINLDMLPKHFVFDAAQPTPSRESSSEGANEDEEEDREEDSEDEVVEVRLPKGKQDKKGQNDLKAQKGVKGGKQVKVEKETDGRPPWNTHCSNSSKVRACH